VEFCDYRDANGDSLKGCFEEEGVVLEHLIVNSLNQDNADAIGLNFRNLLCLDLYWSLACDVGVIFQGCRSLLRFSCRKLEEGSVRGVSANQTFPAMRRLNIG